MELQAGLMLRIRYHQYGWPNCILRLQDEVHRVIVQLFLSFLQLLLPDKKSDLYNMNECFERRFEVWAKANLKTKRLTRVVFVGVLMDVKDGRYKNN